MRRLHIIAPVTALVALAAGCGLNHNGGESPSATSGSGHTIQELCDFPKQFYATQFNADNLEVSVVATKPMTALISGGNACGYHTADNNFRGTISLAHSDDAPGPSAAGSPSVTTRTVDGISITETPVALPPGWTSTEPHLTLSAVIDEWRGEFTFWGRDEPTIQAGAQTLVSMIRALKG